ncbi:MAG: ABC transporter substrate-binding protein [Actinomycetota bacterium]
MTTLATAHRSSVRALALAGALIAVLGACATPQPAEEDAADVLALPTAEADGPPNEIAAVAGDDQPVSVCELAYYTGEFASFGPFLSADVRFPIDEVINLDPPLGRPWRLYNEDLGTLGEAQATRYCLDEHDAEIIVSMAHGYNTYRDQMLEHWATEDGPLVPSVHGGAIPGNLGGSAAEPIFRAQGLDEGLGTSGVLAAEELGAERIVIFTTDTDGFQLAADAAAKAAEAVGIEVLARIDMPAERSSYDEAITVLRAEQPDAVIVQASVLDSAALLRQATDSGLVLDWIGETGWGQPSFVEALGDAPLERQRSIGFAAFGPRTSNPAWGAFSELWAETPGYGDTYGDASDPYHFSTYDLLVHTALAVEAGGSYRASDWAPAMHAVGEAPGEVCYTYPTCLALLRDGRDIDYEGVTGTGDYTDGGVNNVSQTYTSIGRDGSSGQATPIDPDRSLDIIDQIATPATCDSPTLPNHCDW